MKPGRLPCLLAALCLCLSAPAAELSLAGSPGAGDFVLFDGHAATPILVETNAEPAVLRAAGDLADDLRRVTGTRPALAAAPAGEKFCLIAGTLGRSPLIDRLAAGGKLATNGIGGTWESDVLQVVDHPLPGVARALVIAGSDRRGTIYGLYRLSEMIGVSPWYWWADVPVARKNFLALHGDFFRQPSPAVKYRGIFLNDEDWGLRPWASRTFDPATGNIGPKTYAKIFELLLRLHANYLWPAQHPGTRAFNSYPADKELADAYGIVMGSSHCEQMLRDNIGEWDEKTLGEYNFVTNPAGVLKYWEQRVRENGPYENVYTLGMRGISDGGMPGGGTVREKAARLHTIIADQRALLARHVSPDVTRVPQIFCPYKEVLELYRLAPDLPGDITLVWPDDNYGYVRQYSDARERQRPGHAGVYYHVSYWGAPRDYLWLCSTPPALIAEEMDKAFDCGADRMWVLNVGDLKPAELATEFFLKLAWNPHRWNGTNTYTLLREPLARDFGAEYAGELTGILAEYDRLNFQRKPEHMGYPSANLFSPAEAAARLAAWQILVARVNALEAAIPPDLHDAWFELVAYPVRAAALANERFLAPAQAPAALAEIHRLTDIYNHRLAGGKWAGMMSDNPRGQMEFKPVSATDAPLPGNPAPLPAPADFPGTNFPGADFAATGHVCVMAAAHASAFLPGQDAGWRKITGLGYGGEAVSISPVTVPVRATPERIRAESPCLEFKLWLPQPGTWQVTVRALPTFSVETGRPQRYALAFDGAPPQIVALPAGKSEKDHVWQENVLRNAALTVSQHPLAAGGLHTLKIWMVDPGLVLDTIAVQDDISIPLGYVWPAETATRTHPN